MEEGINLDPMRLISVQQRRIAALMNENVQLEAAIEMLREQLMQLEVEANPLKDVTDEVMGAEITA